MRHRRNYLAALKDRRWLVIHSKTFYPHFSFLLPPDGHEIFTIVSLLRQHREIYVVDTARSCFSPKPLASLRPERIKYHGLGSIHCLTISNPTPLSKMPSSFSLSTTTPKWILWSR